MDYKNLDFQELKALSDNDTKLKKISTLEILELMSNLTTLNFEQLILLEKKKNVSTDHFKNKQFRSKQIEYIAIIQNILAEIEKRI
jgi:hypothetical protein